MSQTVLNLAEATASLPELIERVAAGEEIVIARDDRPLARLVPMTPRPRRVPGGWEGKVRISDDFDAPLPEDVLDAFSCRQ